MTHADTTTLLWRDAINREVFHGELILDAPQGVAQIRTENRLYQICHLREAEDEAAYLRQCAQKENLEPTLVVILDGPEDDWEALNKLNNKLSRQGMRLQVANSLVPIEKVEGLAARKVKSWSTQSTAETENEQPSPQIKGIIVPIMGGSYWLNTQSDIRHNNDCRFFGKGKNGRPCTKDEGRACKICGG